MGEEENSDLKRNVGVSRISSMEIPSKMDREYIYYRYYLSDLKVIFERYIHEQYFIFDIGCGNKPFEDYIRKLTNNNSLSSYVGCDVVQSSNNKVDIICEAADIPIVSSKYDVVICTQVIEHVFNHSKVFEEAYRILKPGGIFIVSSNFIWEMHEVPYDYFRFTKYGFRSLLVNSGFEIVEERANGGKWAVLGQLLLQISWIMHDPTSALLKRKLKTLLRRAMLIFCNWFFPFLDDRHKDSSRYTLNYIFVGRKNE
nr:class I SAM-dependent methyltransferase [Parabacteroides goldsteinii]